MKKITAVSLSALLLVCSWSMIASADTSPLPASDPASSATVILFPPLPCSKFMKNRDIQHAARAVGGSLAGVAIVTPGLRAGDVWSWHLPVDARVLRVDDWNRFSLGGRPLTGAPPKMVVLATTNPKTGIGSSLPTCVAMATEEGLWNWPSGGVRVLRSDTTRRVGVVVPADLRATLMAFLGQPALPEGSALDSVDWPDPNLFIRLEEHQRIAFPVQVAAGLAVTIIGFTCIGLIAFRRKIPRVARTVGPWLALSPAVLASILLAAGSLPHLTYAAVIPFVVGLTVIGAAIPLLFRYRGVLSPPAVLGIGVLLYFLIEALLGWPSTLTTLFGGTALDGARFYGLPNVYEGLLVGSGLYIAASRKTWVGVALLAALGLFAGFPDLGADFGGAVTLFAAAGMWLIFRDVGKRSLAARLGGAAAIMVAGTAAVLVANRLATTPTHITAVAASGGSGIVQTYMDRLGIGWDLLIRNPFGFIPVIGLLVLVGIILKPPASIRESFERFPAWRTAMLVIVLAGIVAYFANDTGVASAGQEFAMALAGLFYVPLAMIPANMSR